MSTTLYYSHCEIMEDISHVQYYFPAQNIYIFHLYMKCHKTSITFCQRTWHWYGLVFMLSTFKATTRKTYSVRCDICIKTLCTVL